MARIIKRIVKGNIYYYLEESVKKDSKWIKESIYLGGVVPKEKELEKIYLKFVNTLNSNGILVLTPPFTEFITRNLALKLETATNNRDLFLKGLSPGKKAEFKQREKFTFITDSNAIEGSTLDYNETKHMVNEYEESIRKKYILTNINREEQEAINLDRCLREYEKYLSKGAEMNEKMILNLHGILLSKIEGYVQYRGIWRPVNVRIRGSNHVFPHHQEVPGLMKELLGWYNKNKNLIHHAELAAKFHTKFTSIHPFADGNGRMARLLMNYVLQMNELPFTNIPLNKRSRYMKTQVAGNSNDHKPFVLFLAQEIIKQNRKLT